MKTALAALLFALAASASAQQSPTYSKNVSVVNLLATVHDRNGRIVNNLTADDFILKEDGFPRKIRYFTQESNLPLTVGLLVDTSRSQQDVLDEESRASSAFLDQVLRDSDQAFVAHFDVSDEILQGLTSSRQDLAAALARLSVPDQVATLLYSAVQDASHNVMGAQSGRKAEILLTDGVAYKDPVSIDTAIESAQRADTLLFSIRFSDPGQARRPLRAAFMAAVKEHGKAGLERMSEETGGVSYEVTGNQSLSAIYSSIEEELRNQYSIGYDPGRPGPDGKYHKIELMAKDRHLIVTTRAGYFAK
jgi:VWFA-related protein